MHVPRSIAGLTALLLLAACAAPLPAPPEPPAAALERQARAAEAAGDHAAAARLYRRLAAVSPPPRRQAYRLRAAEALLRGNFHDEARRILVALDPAALGSRAYARRQALLAELALVAGRPEEALRTLEGLSGAGLPPGLQARLGELRARAFAAAGNRLEAVRERVLLARLPLGPEAAARNERLLWDLLQGLSDAALEALATAPPPDPLTGWLELARLARTGPIETLPEALAAWRDRFPGHPASKALLASLEARARKARPRRIALLLPLSGPYAALGRAVRDGLLAAYWAGAARPELLVLDTRGTARGALEAYREAAAAGAEWVIGPLAKGPVRALRHLERLPVPVLALNRSGEETPPPEGFHAFGLAPEDEAQAAAERAWLEGHNQALVLAPQGEWGGRVLAAFARHWNGLGGTVLAAEVYDPAATDFAAPLQRLLAIDASRARARALERLLGRPLTFEPRRRQDADLVFLAAFPDQARQIRPQLRFYYAGDLPVYATSAVYTGHPDPVRDRDMDGIRFPDIPWVLEGGHPLAEALRRLWPEESARLLRLHALGADAYRLLPELPRLAAFPFESVRGATGRLHLDPLRRVRRELLWAHFAGGRPQLLPSLPAGTGDEG